ncbi:hypothetical protein [Aeromicrobium sp.]
MRFVHLAMALDMSLSYDPIEPVIVLLYVAATALLLHGARGGGVRGE